MGAEAGCCGLSIGRWVEVRDPGRRSWHHLSCDKPKGKCRSDRGFATRARVRDDRFWW